MIEPLPWDSEHFSLPIGRVVGRRLGGEDVQEADRFGLRCLYLLADAGDAATIHKAEDLGFRVVDLRLTLDRPARPTDQDATSSDAVRPAVGADLTTLEPVAAMAHADSRFFFDDGFDREASARLYVRWLRASVLSGLADVVLVAQSGGPPSGYITGRAAEDGASFSIGLLGVAARDRGRGLGPALVGELLRAASVCGASRVEVITQGRNVPAQRLYQTAGFRTIRTEVWLHRWSGRREGPSGHAGRHGPAIDTTPLP